MSGSGKVVSSKFVPGLIVGCAIGAAAMFAATEFSGSESGDEPLLESVDLTELSRLAEAPSEEDEARQEAR